MSRVPGLSWRTTILCGLLWGVGVTLADTLTQPVGDLGLVGLVSFALTLLWGWCWTGIVWAIGCKLFVRGRWAGFRAVLLLPLALAMRLATLWISPLPTAMSYDTTSNPMLGTMRTTDLAAYLLWNNLFYGGLYVVGYLVTRRASVARARLAEFRRARSEADLRLREARVDAFRGQLQPAMLLAALQGLRERYADDPRAGDILFDRLIMFLRAAMPSVRSGFSMLTTEIETVQAYNQLRTTLGRAGAKWRIDVPGMVPAIPFPSLILLPALDDIANSLPADATLTLTVGRVCDGLVDIEIAASQPAQLDEKIAGRLRGGLSLTFGSAASLSPSVNLPITIRLRLQPVTTSSEAYSVNPPSGGRDEIRPRMGDRHDPTAFPRND